VHAKRVVDALMEEQLDPNDAWDSASEKIAMRIIRNYSLRFTTEPSDGCDIVLTHVGPNRVNVIKTICSITGLAFKRAHQLVEGAVTTVKKGVPKDKAETIKQRFEAIGATVEIR
jgi:ribosomal protein L7/L12